VSALGGIPVAATTVNAPREASHRFPMFIIGTDFSGVYSPPYGGNPGELPQEIYVRGFPSGEMRQQVCQRRSEAGLAKGRQGTFL
jgi:hypothetical protein